MPNIKPPVPLSHHARSALMRKLNAMSNSIGLAMTQIEGLHTRAMQLRDGELIAATEWYDDVQAAVYSIQSSVEMLDAARLRADGMIDDLKKMRGRG